MSIRWARSPSRFGVSVKRRSLDEPKAQHLAAAIALLADDLEIEPTRSKAENFGLRNRIASFLETGSWPPPPPDGSRLEFDIASPIGGDVNPFNVGARYYRDGDEVIGRVNVGRCHEGPPERVHGGIVCAIFDEVMGSVFRATGTASAFTGELTVRFHAPAPIGQDLEFRARQVETDGRKRRLTGEATAADQLIATATAVFIEMRPEHFAAAFVESGTTPDGR
jgi:acyl-coenzyme A thioesterase PaaI-like protein